MGENRQVSESSAPRPSDQPVRAFVHAGGATTAYLRAGHGAPVVLLVEPGSSDVLVGRLARDFRVVAPEVPAPPETAPPETAPPETTPPDTVADPAGRLAFCRWLRAFCDGLGIERCGLVAGAAYGAAALAFALLEEERVERLVLLDARRLDGHAAELAARTSSPPLCLCPPTGDAAAAEAAAHFLLGGN
jgi:pimeloyl-ACP methyl ester carboxylesterase